MQIGFRLNLRLLILKSFGLILKSKAFGFAYIPLSLKQVGHTFTGIPNRQYYSGITRHILGLTHASDEKALIFIADHILKKQ